jgi:hypothetical protein
MLWHDGQLRARIYIVNVVVKRRSGLTIFSGEAAEGCRHLRQGEEYSKTLAVAAQWRVSESRRHRRLSMARSKGLERPRYAAVSDWQWVVSRSVRYDWRAREDGVYLLFFSVPGCPECV